MRLFARRDNTRRTASPAEAPAEQNGSYETTASDAPLTNWEMKMQPPKPGSAAIGMMVEGEGFHDREFGISEGEFSSPAPSPQPPPSDVPAELVVEPPPWQAELERGDLDPAKLAPLPTQHGELTALQQIKLDDDGFDPPPPPGPPMVTPPLRRPEIPAADWRAEEVEAAKRRETGEFQIHDLGEQP